MEICPYRRESGFWVQDGEPEWLSWCLCRTGRLGWADDAWACTRCGDEWVGEIVWGERDASGGGSGMRLTPMRAIPDQPGAAGGAARYQR